MPRVDVTALRCAVHPSRPANDACPVCARPRCAADAHAAPGGGCLACEGRRGRAVPPPAAPPALIAAAAAAGPVAIVTGLIASEYVGAAWYIGLGAVPAFVGIVVSMIAERAAGTARGPRLRVLAAVYSVLAMMVAYQPARAAESPFVLQWRVLLTYAIAAGTSWLWTVPPRVVKRT
jgi:hypothetical protein